MGSWVSRPMELHHRPLDQVIVQSIAGTTTDTGLKVRCELDQNTYPTGVKVSKAELKTVNPTRHAFHVEWNYSVNPKALTLER